MRYLFASASVDILTQAAKSATLCAFDFDGTLSPIVDHPDHAGMRPQTRDLLSRLAALYPCVVVSGRSRDDVLNKLDGIAVARVIGNHGAETEIPSESSQRRVSEWKPLLEAELKDLPGVWTEDKGLSLTIHYRQAIDKPEARRRIVSTARKLDGAHILGGKRVVNLLADGAPNKGDALAAERIRLGCDCVLYVGDDQNDEDAFALNGCMIPIRIGKRARSHAHYFLRTQLEIDTLLQQLIQLRTSAGHS